VDAVVGAEVAVGEPPFVAEPASVHFRVIAREHAGDLAFARRRPCVAADGAKPTHGRDVLDLPGSRAEPVGGRGKRADRAELDDVAREVGPIGLVLERRDDRLSAAVLGHELTVLRDDLGEAGAAVAEDAALAVEADER
jgi:hypothetical protein